MKGPVIYYPIQEMYGTDLSSTKKANELRESMLEEIGVGLNVEIDMKDVRSITNGWANKAFGVIVKEEGEEFFKNHIRIINMNKRIKTTLVEGIGQMLEA